MQPEALLADLKGVVDGFGHLSVTIAAGQCSTAQEVEDLLANSAWQAAAGWIARQSGVEDRPGTSRPALGAVLEAELGTATASLQIRKLGSGWVWTRLDEVSGGPMLSEDVVLITTKDARARYRRYWTLPDTGAAEVIACRLVGIKEIGK